MLLVKVARALIRVNKFLPRFRNCEMRRDLPAFVPFRSVRRSKRYRATATIPREQIASKIDILSRLRFMHNVQMCTERPVVTDVHAWKRHELFKLANYVNPESVAVNTRAHLRSNDVRRSIDLHFEVSWLLAISDDCSEPVITWMRIARNTRFHLRIYHCCPIRLESNRERGVDGKSADSLHNVAFSFAIALADRQRNHSATLSGVSAKMPNVNPRARGRLKKERTARLSRASQIQDNLDN